MTSPAASSHDWKPTCGSPLSYGPTPKATPQSSLASALRGVVAVWERHGPVLRAIVEAALVDEHVHGLWRDELMERFIEAVTAAIERDSRLGRTRPLPARETATALVLLNERYLADRLGTPPQHDADEVAEALKGIWTRTLYS